MGSRDIYIKTYRNMNFERKGLFELLRSRFPIAKVIYPGCSSHITPSFYFQHVAYIDRSEEAKSFFEDEAGVRRLIADNKVYKQSSYFTFSSEDFLDDKETIEYQYDILISLYADDVIVNCLKFVKHGGIVISNNFHDEVIHVLKKKSLELIGTVICKGNRYIYSEVINTKVNHRNEEKIQKSCMKNTADGVRYFDHEKYYVLRKSQSLF